MINFILWILLFNFLTVISLMKNKLKAPVLTPKKAALTPQERLSEGELQ